MQNIFIFLYLFIFSYGFSETVRALEIHEGNPSTYTLAILAVSLLLLYFVPFMLGVKFVVKKIEGKWTTFVVAFLTGFFMTTFLSSHLNELVDSFWASVLDPEFAKTWQDALSGPFVEEFIKTIFAIFALILLRRKNIRDYVLSGLGIGLGFQFAEDIFYVMPKTADVNDAMEIFPQTINRMSGAISSHWAYTFVIVIGIYMILKYRKNIRGYIYLILPVVLHFIWNSPIAGTDMPYFPPIISAITLFLVYLAARDVKAEIKKEKELNTLEIIEI